MRIIYMIARGTLDENIWDQLQNKHQVVGATVGKYQLFLFICKCWFAMVVTADLCSLSVLSDIVVQGHNLEFIFLACFFA